MTVNSCQQRETLKSGMYIAYFLLFRFLFVRFERIKCVAVDLVLLYATEGHGAEFSVINFINVNSILNYFLNLQFSCFQAYISRIY